MHRHHLVPALALVLGCAMDPAPRPADDLPPDGGIGTGATHEEVIVPGPACFDCGLLASGIPDIAVTHADELTDGADCYAVGVDDDPTRAERFGATLTSFEEAAGFELRLYRDEASCGTAAPLAASAAHGATQSLAWAESADDDTGTLVVQVIRRGEGPGRYELTIHPLE